MGASNSNTKSTNFYSLKAKADEQNAPHFTQSVKEGQNWVSKGSYDTMSGYLSGAELKVGVYNGAEIKKFILTFQDDEQINKIEMTHNQVSYSIIRCLCGLQNKLEAVEIKVARKYDKDKNKYYGNAFLKVGAEDLKWAFPPTDAPKKEPVLLGDGNPFMKDGKPVQDDSKLRAFYEQKFQYVIELCKGGKEGGRTVATTQPDAMHEDNSSDNLPF